MTGQRARYEEILAFWFAGSNSDPLLIEPRVDVWFGAAAPDAEIREHFAIDVAQASSGRLDGWRAEPQGRLALIVLLDQFRRSLFRGTAAAFARDERSLALTLEGLERAEDLALSLAERIFFFLPLQHAESRDAQALSVRKFAELEEMADAAWRAPFTRSIESAREHRDIIARFGRFPHRNRALGRTSTPKEAAYLAAGGATFGQ
ncbi:MAG: DUF924 domain-containing protein [Gammaproteobacteria bacterium]|nr:DUF924 domain-containing protein [Gammaproteobacteria bacterium]